MDEHTLKCKESIKESIRKAKILAELGYSSEGYVRASYIWNSPIFLNFRMGSRGIYLYTYDLGGSFFKYTLEKGIEELDGCKNGGEFFIELKDLDDIDELAEAIVQQTDRVRKTQVPYYVLDMKKIPREGEEEVECVPDGLSISYINQHIGIFHRVNVLEEVETPIEYMEIPRSPEKKYSYFSSLPKQYQKDCEKEKSEYSQWYKSYIKDYSKWLKENKIVETKYHNSQFNNEATTRTHYKKRDPFKFSEMTLKEKIRVFFGRTTKENLILHKANRFINNWN